jgi:hypothetical protein
MGTIWANTIRSQNCMTPQIVPAAQRFIKSVDRVSAITFELRVFISLFGPAPDSGGRAAMDGLIRGMLTMPIAPEEKLAKLRKIVGFAH